MQKFFQNYKSQFENDRVLQLYGSLLCFAHFITGLLWWIYHNEINMTLESETLCWPMLSNCQSLKFLNLSQAHTLIAIYMGMALLISAMFFFKKKFSWTLIVGFISLWVLKILIMSTDYSFRHNAHYMHFFSSLAFLLGPNKRWLCKWQILLFYFWAGNLKLNNEWLSGAALYGKPLFVPSALLPLALIYVVVLELGLVWGLLSQKKWIFWAVLSQFILFHISSWGVVGFFYPMMMFCLLSIFVLDRLFPEPLQKKQWTWNAIYCLFFCGLQLIPKVMTGDPGITNEGRLVALHMFDAQLSCEAYAKISTGRLTHAEINLNDDSLVPRIKCDPVVIWNRAKNTCRKNPDTDFDLFLISKKASETDFHLVINQKHFCSATPEISIWRKNKWIQDLPYKYQDYDLIFITASNAHSAIAKILEFVSSELRAKSHLKIKSLYGIYPWLQVPDIQENRLWALNDYLFLGPQGKALLEQFNPLFLLGQFPLLLASSEKSSLNSFAAIRHQNLLFGTNSMHPISEFLGHLLAQKINARFQFTKTEGPLELFQASTESRVDLSFLPSLTAFEYVSQKSLRPLAITGQTLAYKNILDLSRLSPQLAATQPVFIFSTPSVSMDPLVLQSVVSVFNSVEFKKEISQFSTTLPTNDPEKIKSALLKAEDFANKYKVYLGL